MECHDCSKNLYWKYDPVWENKYDSAYFSPGVLDKYIRCLRCWKLEMDEKGIPYEDEEPTAESWGKVSLRIKNESAGIGDWNTEEGEDENQGS